MTTLYLIRSEVKDYVILDKVGSKALQRRKTLPSAKKSPKWYDLSEMAIPLGCIWHIVINYSVKWNWYFFVLSTTMHVIWGTSNNVNIYVMIFGTITYNAWLNLIQKILISDLITYQRRIYNGCILSLTVDSLLILYCHNVLKKKEKRMGKKFKEPLIWPT